MFGDAPLASVHNSPLLCSLPGCAPEDPLLTIIQAAGWPIWPLILCSVLALALIFERFQALRRPLVLPVGLADEVIAVTRQGLPGADVLDKLASSSVFGGVIAQALRHIAGDTHWQEDDLRRSFELAGRDAAHKLELRLSALGSIATAAPLLGLFGTVVGMIEIFGAQQGGAPNPAELAHGISVALYNTALGLLVAIPSLTFHRHFKARVNEYLHSMEADSERLLRHLSTTLKARRNR
jgi:biopolymer transport protein ExbB